MKQKHTTNLLGLFFLATGLTATAATNTVVVSNFIFSPTNITINVGDVVRWTNSSPASHDSTSTNAVFTWSTNMPTSSRVTMLLFTNVGRYPYFCAIHTFAPLNAHPEQTGTVSVVTASLPPSVTLTNPANNAKFRAPANLVLQAATTSAGTVTNVQFFSGANLLGNATVAPFNFPLNNLAAGNYSFTALAQDNGGLTATSAVVNVFALTNALLTAPTRAADGQFHFTVQGIAGQTYAAESSTNLTLWSAFITNVAPANTFNMTDATSTNLLQRFYRARQDF